MEGPYKYIKTCQAYYLGDVGLPNTPPHVQAKQISWTGLPRGLHKNDRIETRSDTM